MTAASPAHAQDLPMGPFSDLHPRPERVLLMGSSSIQYTLGRALAHQLEARGGITLTNAGRSATGLARLDHFDWLTHAKGRVQETNPELVIAQFGGNDCQSIVEPDDRVVARWGDEAWDGLYAARLRTLVALVHEAGATLVFVGMPRMESAFFSRRIAHVNAIVEQVASETGALYLSTWALTSDGERPRATVDLHGHSHPLRADDGVHLTVRGARMVATALVADLEAVYDLRSLE